ncbi:MAG: tetratricopeptide repeat protein [Nitrospirae bacterium]|nr:MAG: tetratricopeptide repeat protein [Nitrospirota bacterium]
MSTSARFSLFACLVILGFTILTYANSLHGAFVFDDQNSVLGNPVIKDLSRIGELFQWSVTTNPSRALPAITFALNYHFHGYRVEGYHVVNVALHMLNGCLVFLLLRKLFQLTALPTPTEATGLSRWSIEASAIPPLLAALLFVVHPVQTAGVTYITQRHGEMATLFYLLGILAFIKAVTTRRTSTRVSAAALTGLCYLAGLCSKEIAITLPIVLGMLTWLILAPRMRVDARVIKTLVGTGMLLLMLAGSILLWRIDIIALVQSWMHPADPRQWGMGQNLLTQLNVIVQYLSLLALPIPSRLNADRQFPLAESLFEFPTGFSFLIILACVWLGWRLRKDAPLISFGIFWFFITLLPSSSIIPLRDLMVEYRLYLPSIGVWLVVVTALDRGCRSFLARRQLERWAPAALSLIVGLGMILPYAVTASTRNAVWQSPVTFWTDAVEKDPTNVRAYINLGKSYYELGALDEAIAVYRMALALAPASPAAHNNLGTVYYAQGQLQQALRAFTTAVTLKPDYTDAHNNVGAVYVRMGQPDRAQKAFEQALNHNPFSFEAHYNLGLIAYQQDRLDDAATHLQRAIQLEPREPRFHYLLGIIDEARGKVPQAVEAYRRSLELNPLFEAARTHLDRLGAALSDTEGVHPGSTPTSFRTPLDGIPSVLGMKRRLFRFSHIS